MRRAVVILLVLSLTFLFSDIIAPTLADPKTGESADGWQFGFRFEPGDTTYYVIENEFRDSASIPPLLSYTSTLREKRYITQRVEAPPASNKSEADSGVRRVTWTCDRYEVREKGFGPEATYDSIRDLYPPTPLRELAPIPGSIVKFDLNPTTGVTTKHEVSSGNVVAQGTRMGASRSTDHCSLSVENVRQLLDDLGPYYLSAGPHRVGDRWTKSHVKTHTNFGDVTTTLTCEVRGISERQGRKLATLALLGTQTFQPKKIAPTPSLPRPVTSAPTASNRAVTSQPAKPERENKLDKALCNGTVTFDVSRGRLVELVLRRETGFLTEMRGQDNKVTGIRMSGAQFLRVTASDKPPPMPKIVGGLKPPVEPDQPKKTASKSPVANRVGPNAKRKLSEVTKANGQPTSQPTLPPKPPSSAANPVKK
jgi:hypothetical protein